MCHGGIIAEVFYHKYNAVNNFFQFTAAVLISEINHLKSCNNMI